MRVLISFLFLFNCPLLYAQQDTGKVTFHIKDTSKNIQIHFMEEYNGHKDRGLTINEQNGSSTFFWANASNSGSSSFLGDTASADTVKAIITRAFVNDLKECLKRYQATINQLNYVVLVTNLNTGISYGATIDQNFINNAGCNADKLNKLVRLLNTFDKRYRFPK
ncbi:MAG TPA: hypothetical protein VNY36_06490 [Bacteroidia bacterium]|nr:hypothetical protein [Bacteroidia bacterium]